MTDDDNETYIDEMSFNQGKFEAVVRASWIPIFAAQIAKLFREFGVENFLTFSYIDSSDESDPLRLDITLQKTHGKSPADVIAELKQLIEKYDLRKYIHIQKEWSSKTFGNTERTEGICKHIKKEVNEIRQNPNDISEWCDVIILALDGAWRRGFTPDEIVKALIVKQNVNMRRKYPMPKNDNEPSEHIRNNEERNQ